MRDRLAMAIHLATTQIPSKTPHECDYDAADVVMAIYDEECESELRADAERELARDAAQQEAERLDGERD